MLRLFDAVATDLRKLAVLLAILAVSFVALGVGLTATSVLATHDDPNTIHACVYTSSGYTQIMPPGVEPNCRSSQFLVEWQDSASTDGLEARIEALESTVASQVTQISDLETENATQATQIAALELQVPDCLSEVSGDAVFSGCNVQINNGEGSTWTKDGTDTQPGTGNLIVGYNETINGFDRSGSHNVVVGIDHGYSSWGGLVVGQRNQITGEYSSVSGGQENEASGNWSGVSGGHENEATENWSSVSGGHENEASGEYSSVSGGAFNNASGLDSSVSGGNSNEASVHSSSVSGGISNEASGLGSSVSGGRDNTAAEENSAVGGGLSQTTTVQYEFLPN